MKSLTRDFRVDAARIVVLVGLVSISLCGLAVARCTNDASRSLQDMISHAHEFYYAKPHDYEEFKRMLARSNPSFKRVPYDFHIEQGRTPFIIQDLAGGVLIYFLPSLKIGPPNIAAFEGSINQPIQEVAECRVQAPDGQWWFVTRNVDGTLYYIRKDINARSGRIGVN